MRSLTSTLILVAFATLLLLATTNSYGMSVRSISARTFIEKNATTDGGKVSPTYFTLDTARIFDLLRTGGHIQISDFPTSSTESHTIDLKPSRSVFDNRTKCIVATPDGDKEIPVPELRIYRGTVLGEPNSKVVFTLSGCGLLCSIEREGGQTFIFGQLRTSESETEYILVPEATLLSTTDFNPFNCMNDDLPQEKLLTPVGTLLEKMRVGGAGKSNSLAVNTTSLLEAEIAVEGDNYFYKAAGNTDAKAIGYIGALMSMSSMVYEDEAHITFRIPWVKVWAATDPYNVAGNAYALPDKAKAYWQQNYASVDRDIAHVLTSISYGGGGYGWYSLCDKDQSYSVSSPQTGHSYPTFAFTYDAYIISHEVGHNFSLPHSHQCYWAPPLDTCFTKDDPNSSLQLGDACHSLPITARKNPGTIMSYCGSANYIISGNKLSEYKSLMTFSRRVDTVLRANALAAPCITPPPAETVILTSPRGSSTYKGDSTISILWAYANIQKVSLEYSDNSGTTWKQIASNLDAASCAYSWKLPDVGSTNMLVRIFDASLQTTADTSLLFFTIKSSVPGNIAVITPSSGQILPANSSEQIKYKATNTRTPLLIEFSSNNGTNWTAIGSIPNPNDSTFDGWTTPDITSTACKIRIKDGTEPGAVIGTSALFTVKKPDLAKYSNLLLEGVASGKINANTPTRFTWSSEGPVGAGTIQSSTDHISWSDILSVTEEMTFIAWTTPDSNIPTAYFKLTNKNGAEVETENALWIVKQQGSVKNIGGAPSSLTMTQNFPNPVSKTTTINIAIPTRGFVTLGVRNELGVEVAKLLSEVLEGGTYQVVFDVSALASGFYHFTLESNETRLVGKMQVTK